MKKGFTLIELLAVIVILAIIALIAVPIVLNIINDSKESSLLRSAEFYLDAVEYTIADAFLYHGGLEDKEYPIDINGDICKIELDSEGNCPKTGNVSNTLKVEVNGEKPTGGSITINGGNISSVEIVLDEKTIVQNQKNELIFAKPVCTIERQNEGKYSFGDVVTCSGEKFYVIENQDTDTTEGINLLAKYNLMLIENPKQYTSTEAANLAFASNAYWTTYDGDTGDFTDEFLEYREGESKHGQYPYIYDSSSNLYVYIESYREVLESMGLNVIEAKLLSYEQAYDFGCTIPASGFIRCSSIPTWITGSFWLGSGSINGAWYMSDGEGEMILSDFPVWFSSRSIRPVITISKFNLN